MTPESTHQTTAAAPAERRQAVWPWLLLPLAALMLFFLLRTAKDSLPPSPVHHVAPSAAPAPSQDAGSR